MRADGWPHADAGWDLTASDGRTHNGTTNREGAGRVDRLPAGECCVIIDWEAAGAVDHGQGPVDMPDPPPDPEAAVVDDTTGPGTSAAGGRAGALGGRAVLAAFEDDADTAREDGDDITT